MIHGKKKHQIITCNVSTIPVPFISDQDNEENPSTKCNVTNNIVIILECTEFKHQWNIRAIRDYN